MSPTIAAFGKIRDHGREFFHVADDKSAQRANYVYREDFYTC